MDNPAYTQYGNLPLLQLLSVTGLWGIDFLMSWLASVVNWAWERGFAWPRVRGGDGALRQSPGPGAAVWGRAPGPLPRAGQHGAGRRDQPFSLRCSPQKSSTSTNFPRRRCRRCSSGTVNAG